MSETLFLDEQINNIYLQEGLQDIIKRLQNISVLKKVQSAIKSKNINRIADSLRFIPKFTPDEIESIARRKLTGFDLEHKKLARKLKGKVDESEIKIMAAGSTAINVIDEKIKTIEDINIDVQPATSSDVMKDFAKSAKEYGLWGAGYMAVGYLMIALSSYAATGGGLASVLAGVGGLTLVSGGIALAVAVLLLAVVAAIWLFKSKKK